MAKRSKGTQDDTAVVAAQPDHDEVGRVAAVNQASTDETEGFAAQRQLDAGLDSPDPLAAEIDEVPNNVRDLFGAVGNPPDQAQEVQEELFDVEEGIEGLDGARLESAIESLLFASDRLLSLADLRRLTSVRETKKVQQALDDLKERRKDAGIILVEAAGSFRLKTNPANVVFVSRIIQGKPVRLGRAMMETLAIVAYKQPITRPEVDDVRGVDCGPVLRTLLDRNLIRVIGKKEDVGRPLLYGTTPEFLKTFNLSDLTELPTLREFHELGAEESAKMKATFGDDPLPTNDDAQRSSAEGPGAPWAGDGEPGGGGQTDGAEEPAARVGGLKGGRPSAFSNHTVADVPEDDSLIEELERATEAATRAADAGKSEPGSPVS